METEVLGALIKVNIALTAALALVLLLRRPMRALFGARLAYGLWLIAPLTVAAAFTPAPPIVRAIAPTAPLFAGPAAAPFTETVSFVETSAAVPAAAASHLPSLPLILLIVWAIGAV